MNKTGSFKKRLSDTNADSDCIAAAAAWRAVAFPLTAVANVLLFCGCFGNGNPPQQDTARTEPAANSQVKAPQKKALESPVETPPAAADPQSNSTRSPEPELTPAATAVHPVVDLPWSRWLSPDAKPAALDSPALLGDLKSIGHDELPLDEFRRWWSDVPGQQSSAHQQIVGGKRTVTFHGAARLKAPWMQDTWLRLTPFDVKELSLYFWTGDTGVALTHYRNREPQLWAAYAIERQPNAAMPERWGLLTTDSGAVYRSGVATLDFHHHDGSLVMSVAQTPVLAVPLTKAADDVVVIGESRFRGATWLRGEPLPARPNRGHSVAWSSITADESPWHGPMARDADGSLSLKAPASNEIVPSWTTLAKPGLHEVIFRIRSAEPGTGVMLGDADGKPIALLGLLRDRRTGQLTLAGMKPDERRTESDYDFKAFPAPYVRSGQWVRLTAGLGALHISVSGDGRHWGQIVESPVRDVRGAVQSIGLFALPGESPRTITLEHLEVRRLDHLTNIVDAEALQEAEGLRPLGPDANPRDLGQWQLLALSRRPESVAPAAWLDAVALSTLQSGQPTELVSPLVDRLAESSSGREWSAEQQWRFYDDCLQIVDHWPERDAAVWARRYAAAGENHSVTDAWSEWLGAPVWTHGQPREEFQRALANELLEAAEYGRWDLAELLSRNALHWVAQAHPDHQPRDAAKSLEQIARWVRREQTDEVYPLAWRHPFQPQLDKDAYNTRAELQAALDGAAYRDAARIAMSLGETSSSGLLPDLREPNLYVSLPVALSVTWRDYPQFAKTMRQEFTETGLLRVRQAAEGADVDGLRLATLQLFGTAAAAEAYAWLGDRHMALGEFAEAWRCFDRALPSATEDLRDRIAPRRELARSLSGPLPGESRNSAASPSPVRIEGQELTSVIGELRPAAPALSVDLLADAVPNLSPQRYRLEPRARFDGQAGNDAGRGEFREADAFGRQFGVATDARHVYVSNRFQVTAYDRTNGQSKWAAAVGSEQGSAHGHRFTPMTPLVVDNALFVRRLMKAGIELAALDATNGNVRWHHRPGDRGQWLCDPVWTAQGVWALAAHKVDDEWFDLRWTRLHAETGATLSEAPLFRLRDAWQSEVPCRVAVRGWNVIAAVGGTVASFSLHGELHWVRQELWLPPKIDPLAEDHLVGLPVLSETDVLVTQPGSRTVRCQELATGRTKWTYASAELQGILAATDDRIFLAESNAVVGCDRTTGMRLWRHSIDQRLTAVSANTNTVILARELEFKGNRGWLQLVWLDADSGEVRAELPVEADLREDWRFGPWFAVGEQVWSFAGQTWRDPNRDLVALTPIPRSKTSEVSEDFGSLAPWDVPALGPWQSPISLGERRAAQLVLPGWSPFTASREVLSIASSEVRGRTPVLVSRVKKDDELLFLREIAVPHSGHAALRLSVGHQQGQSWQLEVRIDAQRLVEQPVEDSTSTNGWIEHTLPLQQFAGRTVLVQVAQRNGNKPADGLWHEMRIQSQ